ncbi:unnamed protein product, partial [Rotaria sp. Silwood2]
NAKFAVVRQFTYECIIEKKLDSLKFCDRLARYNVTLLAYLNSIIVPDVWKNRLSNNGIRLLCSMKFYRNILNLPYTSSSIAVQSNAINYYDGETQKENSLGTYDRFSKQQSFNGKILIICSLVLSRGAKKYCNQSVEQITHPNSHLSNITQSITYSNHLLEHEINNFRSNTLTQNFVNSFVSGSSIITSRKGKVFNVDRTSEEECIHSTSNIENNVKYSKSNLSSQLYHPSVSQEEIFMNWNDLRSHVIGLSNPGKNLCYINAVLQCLADTPPFINWLFQQGELSNNGKFCIICELKKIINSLNVSATEVVSDEKQQFVASAGVISKYVPILSPAFKIGEQEDSSLFITSLLDHCASYLSSYSATGSTVPISQTVIDTIFGIKLLSTIECSSCLKLFTKEEFFYMLSVEINNINSLSEALIHFTDQEILTGENAYHCSSCENLVTARKGLTIHTLSDILIINFKRSITLNNRTAKLSHKLNFNELLDCSSYMTFQQFDSNKENMENNISDDNIYKLYAVICHHGDSIEQGHYWSYIRTLNDKWFLVDDAHYRDVPLVKVLDNPKNVDSGETFVAEGTESSITIYRKCLKDSSREKNNIDDRFCKETTKNVATVAAGVSMDEVFESTVPPNYNFRLNSSELMKMVHMQNEALERKKHRMMKQIGLLYDSSSSTSTTKLSKNASRSDIIDEINNNIQNQNNSSNRSNRKVNIEYLNLISPHLKKYNSACGLCICTRYFGTNISKSTALLLKCILKCSGPSCKFKCNLNILNNGYCFAITLNRTIFHPVNERVARPIRGSLRRTIMEKFKAGGSVYRIHAQYDEQRTSSERQAYNYDLIGKSKKVFKKIKSEAVAETLLAPDVTLGILQLHDKLLEEINSEGIIKGALQIVQCRPFCVVVFTEASIRLYDAIVNCPESVLSWDATGGIIKNSSAKQCLYYELTISHPNIVNEDSLVPLTFILSECQTLFTVIQWLSTFKDCHRKVFPNKKDAFPKPAIILSDRAQVFLQAALRVFNNESYQNFLARSYRIVTNAATSDDLSKTNIHACLSHFMM